MNYNESQEMYLETILRLCSKKTDVHSIDVADELNYSKPSVSRAMGILKKDGYIEMNKNGKLTLTEAGRMKAEKIFTRHKILTEALKDLGVEGRSAEENACRIEHVITDDVIEAIEARILDGERDKK